jgi:threonine synthase
MFGYEAEGSAAIVQGKPTANPETLATAIRIGNPASWEPALQAQAESNGQFGYVSDPEIVVAYQLLAKEEGVFCEPASAASVAGLFKAACYGQVAENSTVVCVLTGNGLKDPDNAIAYGKAERAHLKPNVDEITAFFKL